MKIAVSKSVRLLCGRGWRKEIKGLIEDSLLGSGRKTVECSTACFVRIDIRGNKKHVKVTASPDFSPELEEYEL